MAIASDQHLIYFWGQCVKRRPVGVVFMLLLLILKCFFFFLKKELLIIHNGLFSAGRLQSKLPCLLWQCPQGESRCPLPATHLHTPSIPTPSLARQWSRPPPPPLQPKKKRRGGRKESCFWRPNAHSIKNCEMKGLNLSLRAQGLKQTSLISHSLINSPQMTSEAGLCGSARHV